MSPPDGKGRGWELIDPARPELGYWNPNREDPNWGYGREQGQRDARAGRMSLPRGYVDLANIYGKVHMSSPALRRILARLSLRLEHTADHWRLYHEPTGNLLHETSVDSDLFGRKLLDWLLGDYVPGLLASGTAPPPPPASRPGLEEREARRARRLADREARRARGELVSRPRVRKTAEEKLQEILDRAELRAEQRALRLFGKR